MKRLKKISMSKLTILCFLLTLLLCELTFSRYETTLSSSNSSSKVALMANDVTLELTTPSDIYPGSDPSVVAIVLTNEENGNVCEVSQSYTMSIERGTTTNIPFEFSLFKDKDCTELVSKDENGNFYDSSFKFEAGIKEERTYYLKINWPEEYNDASYAFEIDYFKVIINSIQRD